MQPGLRNKCPIHPTGNGSQGSAKEAHVAERDFEFFLPLYPVLFPLAVVVGFHFGGQNEWGGSEQSLIE